MKKWMLAIGLALASAPAVAASVDESVITYHNSRDRHGDYIVPDLTSAATANIHLDKNFKGKISGNIYAQPLFWQPAGADRGLVIVATESNIVYALDSVKGTVVWQTKLASPVSLADLPCGNIDPSGITGTPVIERGKGVLYLDALTATKSGPRQLVYALSLADGKVLSRWPIDVQTQLTQRGATFMSSTQGERSALQFFKGMLYVNYGGNFGDCGTYFGTVIEIDPATAKIVAHWQTRANGGGIWAQGGIAADANGLFVTTGNTMGAAKWMDGEAIIRLEPGLAHSTDKKNYFAPSDWKTLDDEDLDLGGTEAIPVNVGRGAASQDRVIAFGKDGKAYLVDRDNLGGIGGQIARTHVSNGAIRTAPAVHQNAQETMVVFASSGSDQCSGSNLTTLNITNGGKSSIGFRWCKPFNGGGAPIVTTTDGSANAIVWAVGAEGDNELHGFDAHTGQVVFSGSGTAMNGLHHFQTILATQHRLYVARDNKVYAFSF